MEDMRLGETIIRLAPAGAEYVRQLERAVKADVMKMLAYDAADFAMLGEWLRMFTQPASNHVIETLVSETVIRDYRMQGEFMLLGLVESIDCGKSEYWGIVGSRDDDPLCDTVAQMNFLKHYWVPCMAETLVTFIAELTLERALTVKPGVLACLQELAKELVELDKLNSDSSQPFAARPNARMELFGDVSRDVLGRRLAAGVKARASVGLEA